MRRLAARALIVAVLVLTAAGAALAAPKKDVKPKYQRDPASPLLPIVYAMVALAGVGVVGFKNSKRTHLD